MKTLVIILLLTASLCFGQPAAKDIHGAWVSSSLDWQYSQFHKNEKWTSAKVLVFYHDGKFGIIGGTVYQTANRMEISYGDSQAVYLGTWKRKGDEITVTYRVIYRDIQVSGGEKESAVRQDLVALNEDGEAVFQDQRFRKARRTASSVGPRSYAAGVGGPANLA